MRACIHAGMHAPQQASDIPACRRAPCCPGPTWVVLPKLQEPSNQRHCCRQVCLQVFVVQPEHVWVPPAAGRHRHVGKAHDPRKQLHGMYCTTRSVMRYTAGRAAGWQRRRASHLQPQTWRLPALCLANQPTNQPTSQPTDRDTQTETEAERQAGRQADLCGNQEAMLFHCPAFCMGVGGSPRRSQNWSRNSSMVMAPGSKNQPCRKWKKEGPASSGSAGRQAGGR